MAFEKIKSKLTPAKGEQVALLGRNEPCHCGSGKKYKKCHLPQDEEAERKTLAKAELPPLPADEGKKDDKSGPKKHGDPTHPSAKAQKGGGFMSTFFNRKSGGGGA
jgi:hypothetical protein